MKCFAEPIPTIYNVHGQKLTSAEVKKYPREKG